MCGKRYVGAAMVCALLSILPAAALGRPWRPSHARTDRAKSVAASAWHRVPCGGEISIRWARIHAQELAVASWIPTGHGPRGCIITFNASRSYTWVKYCSALVHEYGHLLGHGHSRDPKSIMYPVLRTWPACAGGAAPRAASSSASHL